MYTNLKDGEVGKVFYGVDNSQKAKAAVSKDNVTLTSNIHSGLDNYARNAQFIDPITQDNKKMSLFRVLFTWDSGIGANFQKVFKQHMGKIDMDRSNWYGQ